MTDTIIDEIKAAQRAPTDTYMVWAEIETGVGVEQVVTHSVRLPQSIDSGLVLSRTRTEAEQILIGHGYSVDKVKAATLHVAALPPPEETEAELEAHRGPNSELALVDLVMWEAAKHRLHLTPYSVENGDLEMDFKGMKLRRSIAN